MSKKDPIIFLKHILESIEAINQYSKDLSEETFLKSSEKQDAIIRRLEIIGEAVKNLPDEYKKKHPDVEWGRAMGTRNILIHHYFGVDLEIVWDTVTKSLPQFKKQIKSLLETH
ncbi:MAG: hypothetical protein A3B44_02125 [Candidatus Levybacteria bacterium RIFCSPLOWO2_01_FULL_38_21]|nr:MAG: hypothetical protein A3B44_02125 [Candidatus Levybacteria bacterium RIFCSPLOWO2_01_FULL_38_21]